MIRLATAVLGLSFLVTAPMAQAQTVSESEIEAALQRQEQILRSDRGVDAGQTRGIRLAKPSAAPSTNDVVVKKTTRPAQQAGATVVKSTRQPSRVNRDRPVRLASIPKMPSGQQLDLVILFEYDSAFIRPESRPQLSELCNAIVNGDSSRQFHIIGHTDAAGSNRYNLTLSQARAKEVKRHLVTECDVDPSRLNPVGMGEERLLPEVNGRDQQQRRVEILLNVAS